MKEDVQEICTSGGLTILAIDPGTTQSGFIYADKHGDFISVIESGIAPNDEIRKLIQAKNHDVLAIEMIQSFGMPVGKETFETCIWIGRFLENWGGESHLVFRKDVKLHICKSMKAKDPHIRQALIDRFGKPGTKNDRGILYGVKSHAWSALAIAVTVFDTKYGTRA